MLFMYVCVKMWCKLGVLAGVEIKKSERSRASTESTFFVLMSLARFRLEARNDEPE